MPSSNFSVLSNLRRAGAILAPLLAIVTLVAAACSGGGPTDREVLISLTDEVIVPAYQQAAEDAGQLDQKVAALCNAPSEKSLDEAQQAWRSARASWLRTRAMWFGPVMDRRSASQLDWSPTDSEGIDESVASDGFAIDADQVRSTLSADRRGFGSIEHLLFRDDALEMVSNSPPYCGYLLTLTQVTDDEATAILADWTEGGESGTPYRDYFTGRSKLAIEPSAAVEELVRTQVFLIRDIAHMRMATALGLRSEDIDLSAIPGNAADNGLSDLRNELLGMQEIYQGSGGEELGISHLVQPLSQDTDRRFRTELAAALTAVDALEGPLQVAIAQRPEQVNAIYDRLTDVQRTLAIEVVSLLGVSVGFSDADGDSLR